MNTQQAQQLIDQWRHGPSCGAPIWRLSEAFKKLGYKSLGFENGWPRCSLHPRDPGFEEPAMWRGNPSSHTIYNHDQCLSLTFSEDEKEFFVTDSGD